jgi:hypothetical protein
VTTIRPTWPLALPRSPPSKTVCSPAVTIVTLYLSSSSWKNVRVR